MSVKIRILVSVISIVFVSGFSNITTLYIALAISGVFFLLAQINLGYLLKRLSIMLPFSLFLLIGVLFSTQGDTVFQFNNLGITQQGLEKSCILFLKLLITAIILITSLSNKNFLEISKGLSGLGVPEIFITILELTFRYLFLFNSEFKRMQRAQQSRGYIKAKSVFSTRERTRYTNLIGMAFLRSLQRSERIYSSMLARNYNSRGKKNKFILNLQEILFLLCIVSLNSILYFLDRGVFQW